MSEYNHENRCHECDATGGHHYPGCTYEGTEGNYRYSSGSGGCSSGSGGKVWLFYIIALIIGYGINELLGAILLIGMIFWLIVCK